MKQSVDVLDYAGEICTGLKKGVLLTTRVGDKVNTMTIGWGTLGWEWNKLVFVAYVRENRYTYSMLQKHGEFTVNIPMDGADPSIIKYCGSVSGADHNKIQDMNLTLEPSVHVSVPGIREFPLTLECRVIYSQPQPPEFLPKAVQSRFYSSIPGTGEEAQHIAFYGEILGAYMVI